MAGGSRADVADIVRRSMRIALVTSRLARDTRGGAERYAEDAARSLAEHHDVLVLTGSKAPLDGIQVVRLPGLPYHEAGSGTPSARVLWHARDQWRPAVHATLIRELKRFRAEVVATHEPQGLSAAVFTAVAARRLPHVYTAHDLNVLCARTTMTREGRFCGGRCLSCLVQRGIRGGALRLDVSALIAVSRYILQRHVRARVVPPERAVAIRLGAGASSSRLRAPTKELTLGFIGALSPHKGVRTLLAAFARADPTWRLNVAGTGPLRADVEAAVRSNPRISYCGYLEGHEKEAFFDSLDLLVIPSEWEEPATLVAAEALVRGLPCVVSARGGLPETPESRMFRSGNPEELLGALEWFIGDPDRIAAASRALIARRDEFTWATHISRVERLLQTVRETPRPAAEDLAGLASPP
jgi:glycosyltransferase involved in cell wall biosynthesis